MCGKKEFSEYQDEMRTSNFLAQQLKSQWSSQDKGATSGLMRIQYFI